MWGQLAGKEDLAPSFKHNFWQVHTLLLLITHVPELSFKGNQKIDPIPGNHMLC
jgi:hypothetical protein